MSKEYTTQEIIEIINDSVYTDVFISDKTDINIPYLNSVLQGKKTMGNGMKVKITNFIYTHIKED
jgi:hypothetical protein